MKSVVRSIGAVVAGIVAATAIILIGEMLNARMYPMPPGTDPRNVEAMREWILGLPALAFLVVGAGWAVGAFVGGAMMAKISRQHGDRNAIVLGTLLLISGIVNLLSLPHPLWMWFVAFAVFIPGAYLGAKLVEKKPSPA